MPRNVRPSWCVLEVEGRKSRIATGPVARTGMMEANFSMRDHGSIDTNKVTVTMLPDKEGLTTLLVVEVNGKRIHEERVRQ